MFHGLLFSRNLKRVNPKWRSLVGSASQMPPTAVESRLNKERRGHYETAKLIRFLSPLSCPFSRVKWAFELNLDILRF